MEKQYPGYSEKRIETITAGIWHDYPESTQKTLVERYELSACISSGAKDIFGRMFKSRLEDVDKESKEGKFLKSLLSDLDFMPVCVTGGKARKPRKVSKWQLCIKKEMAGKPWDPSRIKKLAVLYRKGECP